MVNANAHLSRERVAHRHDGESDQNQEPVQREGPGAGRFGPERRRSSDRLQDFLLPVPEELEGEDHGGEASSYGLWVGEASGIPGEGRAIRIVGDSLCVSVLQLLTEL